MNRRRFLLGLGLQGAAVALLLLALAIEHSELFRQPAVSMAYLVTFSALGLAGVALMWSDTSKKPLRWVVASGFTLAWAWYHLVLVQGPGGW